MAPPVFASPRQGSDKWVFELERRNDSKTILFWEKSQLFAS